LVEPQETNGCLSSLQRKLEPGSLDWKLKTKIGDWSSLVLGRDEVRYLAATDPFLGWLFLAHAASPRASVVF
jgi:hypothetical protein